MAASPTLVHSCTRPAAPDRHPPIRSVAPPLFRLDVRRPASTVHAHLRTTAAEATI